MPKSLVFAVGDRPVMALVAGDRRAREAALPAAAGLEGKARRATAEEVRAATGFAIGGVAPVGHATALPVVIDASLARFERLYAAAGRHLRESSPPGARVAAMEIGALAYVSDRPVLDLIGLVNPEVLRARAAGRLPAHVAEAAPETILVPPPFLGRELGDVMRHPEIRARYRPAARFFDPAYEHDPVTLYRRRPGP